jgi:hypothetical protein
VIGRSSGASMTTFSTSLHLSLLLGPPSKSAYMYSLLGSNEEGDTLGRSSRVVQLPWAEQVWGENFGPSGR